MMAGFFVTVFKIVTALIHIAGLVLCWKYFKVHKFLTFVLFIIILISSIGYSISILDEIAATDRDRPPDITGYVLDKDDEKLLVVSKEPTADGHDVQYDVAWILNVTKPVRIGQQIEVWYVRDVGGSFPREVMARQSSIIYNENIDEDIAIQTALSSDQLDSNRIHAVHSVEYDEENNIWSIQLVDIQDEQNILTIEVEN